MNRYETMEDARLLCRDCSTRSTGVVIPADERGKHDRWHDDVEAFEAQVMGA